MFQIVSIEQSNGKVALADNFLILLSITRADVYVQYAYAHQLAAWNSCFENPHHLVY